MTPVAVPQVRNQYRKMQQLPQNAMPDGVGMRRKALTPWGKRIEAERTKPPEIAMAELATAVQKDESTLRCLTRLAPKRKRRQIRTRETVGGLPPHLPPFGGPSWDTAYPAFNHRQPVGSDDLDTGVT